MSDPPESPMILNPGPKPRKSTPFSCRKCLTCSLAVLGLIILVLFLVFAYLIAKSLHDQYADPHKHLFQNQTLNQVTNRSTVVRPLVGKEDRFDIAATVWLRGTLEEQRKYREAVHPPSEEEEKVEVDLLTGEPKHYYNFVDLPNKVSMWMDMGARPSKAKDDLYEIPLFSNIIFRNVKLSDKGLHAQIKFSVPTDVFVEKNVTNQHLRGSFLLIPSDDSFRNFKNFSSWMPDYVLSTLRPMRTWPFPLGNDDSSHKNLIDEAIDSFGINVPLIEFHPIKSRCPSNSTWAQNASSPSVDVSPTSTAHNVSTEDDDEDEEYHPPKPTSGLNDTTAKVKPHGSNIPKFDVNIPLDLSPAVKHPHVVTRTHLRVLDETRLFNRRAYNRFHNKLRATSCGQAHPDGVPHRDVCQLTYKDVGSMQTRLEFAVEDEDGVVRTEFAYAPFLSKANNAAGPLDFVPVPVMKENCTVPLPKSPESEGEDSDTDTVVEGPHKLNDTMDITWEIVFSGRTPTKMLFGELVSIPVKLNDSRTDYENVESQDWAELWNGIRGHKFHPDSHPRRRMFLSILHWITLTAFTILHITYWLRLRSTVGISLRGAWLQIACLTLNIPPELHRSLHDEEIKLSWGFGFLFGSTMILGTLDPLMLLKGVERIELKLVRVRLLRWLPLPWYSRSPATHLERASARTDAKMSWRLLGSIFMAWFLFDSLLDSNNYVLISAMHPPFVDTTPNPYSPPVLARLMWWAAQSGNTTSRIAQLLMNARSRTYASHYKAGAVFEFVNVCTVLLVYVRPFVGENPARGPLVASTVVWAAIVGVDVWQALTLPAVKQEAVDESEK